MPNMADLMKRRMALTDEAETLVGRDDRINNIEGYDTLYANEQFQEPEESAEEEPDREEIINYAVEETKPVSNAGVHVPKMPMLGGIGGLADYGSDSDGDDVDGNDTEVKESVTSKTAALDVPRFIPRSFPIALSNYEPSHFPSASSQVSIPAAPFVPIARPGAPAATIQPVYAAPQIHKEAPVVDDEIADLFASMEDKGTASAALQRAPVAAESKPKPALKSIQRDSALTAFLPTSLRIKRPALQTGLGQTSKAARQTDNADIAKAAPVTVAAAAVKLGGVEDAYLSFLDEIGEMTG